MRSWCNHEGIQWFSRYKEMQGLGSWNQFLKISNYLKTCSTSFPGAQCLILLSEFPSGDVEGQQLQQCRVQSPHRQMTGAFGKRPFVVHSSIGKCIQRQRVDYYLPKTRGLGKIGSDWSGVWRFCWCDENLLKWWWWWLHNSVNILKAVELYTLSG